VPKNWLIAHHARPIQFDICVMRKVMKNPGKRSRRRGIAIIYVIIALIVMLGFCSLAVDLGRVQTAKTELRRAADAAARAGAAYIPQGTSAVQSAAIAIAAQNKCDGASVVLTNSNISVGIWNKSTNTFSTSGTANNTTTFQAVQISALRTKANGNPIPLLFGSILGASTCNVTATSVAALVAVSAPITDYVSAHGNPWLAGEPAGTLGSVPDDGYGYTRSTKNNTHPWEYDIANPAAVASAVTAEQSSGSYTLPTDSSKVESTDYSTGEPYGSPVAFNVTPGSVIQISVPVSNTATNSGLLDNTGNGINTSANGNDGGSVAIYSDDAANPSDAQGTVTTSGSEHGISNIATPINSMVGVFMDQNGATYGADSTQETSESNAPSTPSGLDFSTQAARDYTALQPQLNQSFYVGDGQTSSGVQQTIIVPANAYTLFLGTMDGHEWSNNQGGFNATITEFNVELVH
jgi:Flp pilus assembly protein TadG